MLINSFYIIRAQEFHFVIYGKILLRLNGVTMS